MAHPLNQRPPASVLVAAALRTVMMSPALPGPVPVPAPAATQNQVEDERLVILAPLQLTPLSHWTTVSYFYSIHLTISSISFLPPPFISWGIPEPVCLYACVSPNGTPKCPSISNDCIMLSGFAVKN